MLSAHTQVKLIKARSCHCLAQEEDCREWLTVFHVLSVLFYKQHILEAESFFNWVLNTLGSCLWSFLIRFSCVQVLRPLKVQLLILTPPLAIDSLQVIVQSWCKMTARSRQNVTFCWVKYAINTLHCANVDGYLCEWRTNATNNRVSHYNCVQSLKRLFFFSFLSPGWRHVNPFLPTLTLRWHHITCQKVTWTGGWQRRGSHNTQLQY